jgi:hypothetical protein
MKRLWLGILAGVLLAAAPIAQAVENFNAITPLTRDLGALVRMTAQGAATVTSADQSGFNASRVICVFNQASHTGTPSSTFKIQNKDGASGAYYDLIVSAAITDDTTPTAIYAGAGLAATTNVSAVIPLARTWRVSVTVGGTATPKVTGTVGCSVQ